jgi:diacylglycerol kinase (ATP)
LARRVDLIVNRLARYLVEDGGLRDDLVRAAGAAGARVHETRSLAELDEVVGGIRAQGADAVVLAGGDGSYMAGVSALERAFGSALPEIAFAPGGTVSTVARNWGFRGSMAAYGIRLLRAVAVGDAAKSVRPTLRVRDAAGRSQIGFIFGSGLVASFFEVYYARGSRGYGDAARIVGRVFAGSFLGGRLAARVLRPVPCTLAVDGREEPQRAWGLVAASVVGNLGLGMRVLYRAAEEQERFHVVASPLGVRRLGPQLPLVLAGKRLLGKGHVDALARELRVAFTTERDAYVLDGELLHAREVRLTAGPSLAMLSV